MSPLVSIGIPCFNAGRWVSAAVQSALDQTWPATEVIVVDDGSTDDSLAALKKFGDAIRVVCAEHRGGNHARNLVLENAHGEWVQFLDADDYLEPEKITQQFAEAGGGADADVIYSPTWLEDSRKNTRLPSELDPGLDLFAQWLAWQMPQTGGALWRKSTLDALGGWKEGQPCCQEHELYLRALQAGARFRFAPTPHAAYRLWSEETLCRRDPRKVIYMRTSLMDQLQKWMTSRGLWKPVHARVAGRAFFEMSRSLANLDLEEGTRYFHERKSRGLIHLDGPAAPRSYRMALCLLGFSGTEKLAAIRR